MKGRRVFNRLGTTTVPGPNRFSVPHKRDENRAQRTCACGKEVYLTSSIENALDDIKEEIKCFDCYQNKK